MDDKKVKENSFLVKLKKVVSDPEIPKFYANSFGVAFGNADFTVLLERNNVPVAVFNMSFTVAKTLGIIVGQAISDLEDQTAHTIMTTQDVEMSREEGEKSDYAITSQ